MIDVQGLSFQYGNEGLFQNLSLELEPGLYGLLGKNGAGKSTFLKILTGMLFPQGGTIKILSQVPAKRSPLLLRELYFLSEEFSLPAITGRRHLGFYAPFYPRFDRQAFFTYAEELQLDLNKKLSQFSYGQKKKYLIAFGLASGARVLLLDEPTNGLDIPSKAQFRSLIAAALTDERCIIISTHQVRDVASLIDPIIIVDDGRIIFQHTMEEISRGIRVDRFETEPTGDKVLYVEKGLGGWFALMEGGDADGAGVDLELLFNGVIQDPLRIKKLVKGRLEKGGLENER